MTPETFDLLTGGAADPLRLYLRKVEAVPQMTREDEVAVGERIAHGQRSVTEAVLASPLAERVIPDLRERRNAVLPSEEAPGTILTPGEVDRVLYRLTMALRTIDRAEQSIAAVAKRIDRSPDSLAALSRSQRAQALRHMTEHAPPTSAGELAALRAELETALRTVTEVESDAGANVAELRDLQRRVKAGVHEVASGREALVRAHLRNVVWMARRYLDRGVPLLDLVQEGNIGLMSAANKFDHRLGVRFATYANWWIRQAMTRALSEQGRTVRLPSHRAEALGKLARARRTLSQRLGRDATPAEVAEELRVPPELVENLLQWATNTVSLEMPIGEDRDGTLSELVGDPTAELPSSAAMASELNVRARQLLTALTPREQEVLSLRFGLNEDHELTLEEIGSRFGLTRERIRQIEAKALNKLRHPSRVTALRGFIEG